MRSSLEPSIDRFRVSSAHGSAPAPGDRERHGEAFTELTDNASTHFDPQVVEALVGHLYGRRQSGLAAV